MDVFETSNFRDKTKIPRPIDDLSPRALLRKSFSQNKIEIEDHNAIEQFSDEYCLEKHFQSYIQHWKNKGPLHKFVLERNS